MEHRLLWDLTGPEIEAESFRRIDAEASPEQRARFTAAEWHVARRLVHTTADFGILDFLKFTPGAVESLLAKLPPAAVMRSCTEETSFRIFAAESVLRLG